MLAVDRTYTVWKVPLHLEVVGDAHPVLFYRTWHVDGLHCLPDSITRFVNDTAYCGNTESVAAGNGVI